MNIREKVERVISKFNEDSVADAKYLVMDDQTYFSLKEEVFGSIDIAISEEIEDYSGLKVFHNNIGYTFVDVA